MNKEELIQKLAELESQAKEKLEVLTKDLDDVDKLMLENILLKERLWEKEKNDMRNTLYAELIRKHELDVNSYDLTIDAPSAKIILTPKK